MKSILVKVLLGLWLGMQCSISFSMELVPCWLNNPVTENQIGFIGAANPFSSKINGSLIASRKRALTSLSDFYKFDVDITKIDFEQDEVLLKNKKTILFSEPYVSHNVLYSYAIIQASNTSIAKQHQWLIQKCSEQTCDFKQCSPLWLCHDDIANGDVKHEKTKGFSAIHGVSQITSNPAMQLATTQSNAQELLRYITKSDVENHSYVVKSTDEFQSWGYTKQSSSVESLGATINLLNTHSCQTPNYLFARYIFPSPQLRNVKLKPFSEWLRAPNYGAQTGVVGAFDGIIADGRFSSAIKLAVKNGLIELAKTKKITIEHDYQLKYKNGSYSLSKTSMDTKEIVSAQLQDIKIIEKNNKLIIYAWLLESITR